MIRCSDPRGHYWTPLLARMGVMRWGCTRCGAERFEED